jgi:hypothetical protein
VGYRHAESKAIFKPSSVFENKRGLIILFSSCLLGKLNSPEAN